MNVPGKDDLPGIRGNCFPKDMTALIYKAKESGADPSILESAWRKNLEIVTEENRNWSIKKSMDIKTY
jgi:UDP-glucose 6-dehydrogenase